MSNDDETKDESADDSAQQSEDQPTDSDQSTEPVDEQPGDTDQAAEQTDEQAGVTQEPVDQSEEQTAESEQPAEQAEEQPGDSDHSVLAGEAGPGAPPVSGGTHASVRNGFLEFSRPLEGRVQWMYLDIKGLVTTAVGNLIDPVELALKLPFVHKKDESPASEVEISTEWRRLKDDQSLAQKGHRACEGITDLRLTDAAIDQIVLAKFDSNDRVLRQAFSNWNEWPADAQLGAHSIAWAGAGFPTKWKDFRAAAEARDWKTAAAQSHLDETGNPGVKQRNVANAQLFHNADVVESGDLDRATVFYPQTL